VHLLFSFKSKRERNNKKGRSGPAIEIGIPAGKDWA